MTTNWARIVPSGVTTSHSPDGVCFVSITGVPLTAGAPALLLKAHRGRVLTATEPALVLRRLSEAFDAFAAPGAAWRSAA